MRRIGISAGLLALSATVASPAAAPAVAAASTPAKDTFNGRIVSATSKLSKDHGSVTILVHVTQSTQAARPLQLTFRSPSCGSQTHCLQLAGELTGTISAHPSVPDTGRRYSVQVSGRLAGLGRVTATGGITGVGFIRQGHEGLNLSLRTAGGQLGISAVSPPVPGFTSP